jgi:type IV pilus assembly protein PilF
VKALCALLVTAALQAACVSSPVPAPAAGTNPPRDTSPVTDSGDPERLARARLELAGLYFSRGQSATALAEIKTALTAKPDIPEAYSLRGLVQAAMGDAGPAEDSFRRALQLAPRDGDTLHNYGWFLCQQKRYAEADVQFGNALVQPQYRDLVRTLLAQGVCQARADRWVEAERTLSRSYELDPANPVTAYNLAEVLLRRGEFERARFYVGRINAVPEQATAQSLWLATRIEHKLGNAAAVQNLGRQLQDRFPQSGEALKFDGGRFDD